MSYKTYTTEGIVCGSSASNTSDRSFLIFTREAGMLFASARSVREERSKQRYALQEFSRIRVSLVKGKSGWRIGSVEPLGNGFLAAATREERGHVSFLIMQLRRYVHGEVALARVYDDTVSVLAHFLRADVWEVAQRVFMVRLLSELGYIAALDEWRALVDADTFADAFALHTPNMAHSIEKELRNAAEVSHL